MRFGCVAISTAIPILLIAGAVLGLSENSASDEQEEIVLGDHPTAKYSLIKNSKHSEFIEEARIAPDGKTVAVRVFEYTLRVDRIIANLASEIVTTILVILWLIIALIGWRRRGRVIGEPHCRKCGYQLTQTTSTRCPECGANLPKNTVIPRRRAWVRPLQFFLIFATAIYWMLWQSEAVTRFTMTVLPRWDSAALHRWAMDNDIDWDVIYPESSRHRIDFYQLEPWELKRSVILDLYGEEEVFELELGAKLMRAYGVIWHDGPDPEDEVVAWDLATGSRETLIPRGSEGYALRGVSQDESLICILKDGLHVHRTVPDGSPIQSWEFDKGEFLRIPGYVAILNEGDKTHPIFDIATGEQVGVTPVEPWFIVGVDRDNRLLLTDSGTYELGSGQKVEPIPLPAQRNAGFPRAAPSLQLTRDRWIIIEVQTVGTLTSDGEMAIGIWSVSQHKYVARFDGPYTYSLNRPGLSVSQDNKRAVLIGDSMLWVYDLEPYLDE